MIVEHRKSLSRLMGKYGYSDPVEIEGKYFYPFTGPHSDGVMFPIDGKKVKKVTVLKDFVSIELKNGNIKKVKKDMCCEVQL